jgi:hypothetical protein
MLSLTPDCRRSLRPGVRAATGRCATGVSWGVITAATALIALVNGLQTHALVDQTEVVDAFVAQLVTKEESR